MLDKTSPNNTKELEIGFAQTEPESQKNIKCESKGKADFKINTLTLNLKDSN